MENKDIGLFLDEIADALKSGAFIKLSLGGKRYKDDELKGVSAKIVEIKREKRVSFTYSYNTKDVTKNYDFEGSVMIIETLLETSFFNGNLFTANNDFQLIINAKNGRAKLIKGKASLQAKPEIKHDKEKKKSIELKDNIYLRELGITGADWNLKKDMSDKYRQINKYIEIFDGMLKQSALKDSFHIVDMGSGKGYLTFALYDYLTNSLGLNVRITGVEYRDELVVDCNLIAKKARFENLKFVQGSIADVKLDIFDVLIALHACDTATDDALYRGIKAGAELIICAPCCHKQVRRQMNAQGDLQLILKHGILEERQAELLTDGIRAAILESEGYKTKVFEFISTEHTLKNVMIVGIKGKADAEKSSEIKEQISRIKSLYGIEYQELERKLGE